MNCKCTIAQSLVGDGCSECNPKHYIQVFKDTIHEQDKEIENLKKANQYLRDTLQSQLDKELSKSAAQRTTLSAVVNEAWRKYQDCMRPETRNDFLRALYKEICDK